MPNRRETRWTLDQNYNEWYAADTKDISLRNLLRDVRIRFWTSIHLSQIYNNLTSHCIHYHPSANSWPVHLCMFVIIMLIMFGFLQNFIEFFIELKKIKYLNIAIPKNYILRIILFIKIIKLIYKEHELDLIKWSCWNCSFYV